MADNIINSIYKHLRLLIQNLGIIIRYKGINTNRTKFCIKIHCYMYLIKMLSPHGWLESEANALKSIVPFPADKHFLKELQESNTPQTELE